MSEHEELIAARKRAEDAVDELRIEDELADGFRSRNGDLTLQDAITALNALLAALPTPPASAHEELIAQAQAYLSSKSTGDEWWLIHQLRAALVTTRPTPPVAGRKTAAQLLQVRRDAGLTAADMPKDYAITAPPVAGEPEREALVRVVAVAMTPLDTTKRVSVGGTVDAILAAGYTKPRTVTTVEELDALPVDTIGIVSHPGGPIAVQYTGPRGWYLAADSRLISTAELLRVAGPITILFTPSTEVI